MRFKQLYCLILPVVLTHRFASYSTSRLQRE